MPLWRKLAIAGGSMLAFGILVGFIVFPPFLRKQVKKQIALKPGAEMRTLWSQTPFPLDFRIYLFNITNADEIKTGAKPIVQQVGPFFYDEWKEKVDLVDREEDDTVEYSNKATWIFNKKKSGPGLHEDMELVFPHIMILSMVYATVRERPGMVGLAAKAVDSIFHKPDSVFVKATVREILWTGLPVDCSVQDFAGKAVCGILREDDSSLLKDGETNYKFAIFGPKNGTVVPDRLRVKRGVKSYLDVGIVTEYKGEPKLSNWLEDSDCNLFNGTDSTIFHPFLYQDEDVVSFAPDLCRSLGARFSHHSSVKGLKTNHYTAELGDMSKDPELKCFCQTPETCLKKGLFDLFNCVKAPLVASLPHLYLVDESYLEQVDGLHPNKDEHGIFLEFEPMTGSPLSARKRLQFNMFIHPVEKFKLLKTAPTALLPLFWVEEGILLGDDIIGQLKTLFKVMSIMTILKWTMTLLGIGLIGGAGGLYYKDSQASQKLEITKISPNSLTNGNKNWPLDVNGLQSNTVPPALDG
uniref:Sensory neuron membrane protein 1 n=1 Tax=Aphidius gifuensis TaxID=684658 RepID=A0A2U9K548_APHGI|nr:sensory neuron membrane protein 1 [Aphidius gifuensis]